MFSFHTDTYQMLLKEHLRFHTWSPYVVLKVWEFTLPQSTPFAERALWPVLHHVFAGVLPTQPPSILFNIYTHNIQKQASNSPRVDHFLGWHRLLAHLHVSISSQTPSYPPCSLLFFLLFLILFQDFRGTINQFQRHIKAAGSCNPQTTLVFPFSPVLSCLRDEFSPLLHLHFIFQTLPKEPMWSVLPTSRDSWRIQGPTEGVGWGHAGREGNCSV